MSAGIPGGADPGERAARRCPVCGKPAAEPFEPFCSKRHADLDLHRWLSGGYAIPGSADSAEDGDGGGGAGDEDELRSGDSEEEAGGDIRRRRG